MAVDPSIALGFRPPEMPSQVNMLGQILALKNAQQQNQLGALQMQEAQAAGEERNALRKYLAGNPNLDTPEGQSGLYGIAPTQAGGILKGRLDLKKTQGDIAKTDAETLVKTVEAQNKVADQFKNMWAQVKTPEQAAALNAAGYAHPILGPALQKFGTAEQANAAIPKDPQQFGVYLQQQILGADEFIKRNTMTLQQQVQAAQAQQTAAEQARHNKTSEGLTARGQNMADARAREATAATMTKPFEVTGPDGLPMLVQQDKQGNIKPVEGYGPKSGSNKPLTDSQAKALLFGTRAQESDKILESLGSDYSPAAINAKGALSRAPVLGGLLGAGANAMLSDTNQKAEQAQRDFINAVLRRESGAVIADSEFANAAQQYFPQPGDSKAVLEQKAKNRRLAVNGLLAEVPEGRRNSITPQAPAGVKFLGFEN